MNVSDIYIYSTNRTRNDSVFSFRKLFPFSSRQKKIEIKFLPKAGMLRTFNLADRISISNPLLLPWLLKCISSQSLAAFGVILKYT